MKRVMVETGPLNKPKDYQEYLTTNTETDQKPDQVQTETTLTSLFLNYLIRC